MNTTEWDKIRLRCQEDVELGSPAGKYLLEIIQRVCVNHPTKIITPTLSHHELHLWNDTESKKIQIHPPINNRLVVTVLLLHRDSKSNEMFVVGEYKGSDLQQSFEIFDEFMNDI